MRSRLDHSDERLVRKGTQLVEQLILDDTNL